MEHDLVSRSDARALAVDIFRPAPERANRCAVALLHGGGWSRGSRAIVHPYAHVLAAAGYTAFAAEYRLIGEAPWPAQIHDVLDVIGWIGAHAVQMGIDADKIAAGGFSAGGHLALLAAGAGRTGVFDTGRDRPATPVALAAVFAFFAPVDLTRRAFPRRPPPLAGLFGEHGNEDLAEVASPLGYAGPDFPPTFLLCGTRDPFLPFRHMLAMFDALDAAGVGVDLHLYQGQTHEFAALPRMTGPVIGEVAAFLERTVVNPAAHAHDNLSLNPFANGTIPLG
jgi:acetyl esterase/lipase